MEKAHHHHQYYWMWMKRKQNDDLLMKGTSSWEEKAFAEDQYSSSRSLGGCIWPPRSYSCSFCMREFRSAQALGGHMNVHRRDRARLKQCLINPNTPQLLSHHHNHDSNISLHNYNLDPDHCSFPSNNYNSRVSATKDHELPFLYPFSSSSSSAAADPCSGSFLDSKPRSERNSREESEDWIWLGHGGDGDNDHDHVETDLCVGLNSVVGGNRSRRTRSCGDDESDCKKTTTIPFFINHCHLQSQVIELKAGPSLEDLDLELRLGDSPKVN